VGIPHATAAQAHRAIGFSKHTVDDSLHYALDVYATDVDVDGDVDILGSSFPW